MILSDFLEIIVFSASPEIASIGTSTLKPIGTLVV